MAQTLKYDYKDGQVPVAFTMSEAKKLVVQLQPFRSDSAIDKVIAKIEQSIFFSTRS